MQDNFQQSSMPHYSTATSIDGNGTNEGHCSFTTKYHGQGHTPIKIYPSLSTFLLLSQTQNNKTAIDSNLAESFFHFLGPKCDFLDAEKLAQGIEISTVFSFFFSLSFFLRRKRGSGVRYHEVSISTQVPDSYSDAVPRQWMREERLVIAFCSFWLICNDSFLFHSAHRR